MVGTYSLKYFVELDNHYTDSVERIVFVVDIIPPAIYFPLDTIIIEVYNEIPVVWALFDNYCSQQYIKVYYTKTYDTSKLGNYMVKFWAEDCFSNISDTVYQVVKVVDTTPPVLTWTGPDTFFLASKQQLQVDIDTIIKITDNYDTNLIHTKTGTYYSDYLVDQKDGCYSIIFKAIDNSGNQAKEIKVWVCIGTTSIFSNNPLNFSFYPNPFKDEIVLNFLESSNYDLRIFSQSGQLVFHQVFEDSAHNQEIGLTYLSEGIYILQVASKEGIKQYKLIKQ
jgi:hypothetical protein